MTSQATYRLKCWSAWAPTLCRYDEWCAWAGSADPLSTRLERLPALFVPALLRRRCSTVSRAALAVAAACLRRGSASETVTVFASQHGEREVMTRMLTELARRSPLSPNDFTLSVHNVMGGLFSLLHENKSPSTAVSAGVRTFDAALFEVLSAFSRMDAPTEVLMVYADMPPAEEFEDDRSGQSVATAALFSRDAAQDGEGSGAPLLFEYCPRPMPQSEAEPGAVEFLRWAFSDAGVFRARDGASAWSIVRGEESWEALFEPIDADAAVHAVQ